MADVMMALGDYRFSVAAAAYEELSRTTAYEWAEQARTGQHAALQFTGPGADEITLSGVVFPQYRAGTGQPDRMRQSAAAGDPLTLIDGRGRVLGRWVILRVEERQSVFERAGVPRRQEFTISLRYFDDGKALYLQRR